jgi:hypothetical protein
MRRPVMLLAVLLALAGCASDDGTASPSTASEPATTPVTAAATTPPVAVPLTVAIEGLAGAQGQYLAGIVSEGPTMAKSDGDVVGGFSAVVDGDPYSADLTVRAFLPVFDESSAETFALCTRNAAPSSDCLRFPFVGEVVSVAPGTYTLSLWIDKTPMAPYARWLPASSVWLRGCTLTFDTTGQAAPTVTVTGMRGTNLPCLTG